MHGMPGFRFRIRVYFVLVALCTGNAQAARIARL